MDLLLWGLRVTFKRCWKHGTIWFQLQLKTFKGKYWAIENKFLTTYQAPKPNLTFMLNNLFQSWIVLAIWLSPLQMVITCVLGLWFGKAIPFWISIIHNLFDSVKKTQILKTPKIQDTLLFPKWEFT
jgi:hypothetical protein